MTARRDSKVSRVSGAAVPRHPRGTRKGGAGGTLLGVFIGVVLGLSIASAVAFYLMRSGNPYQTSASAAREAGRDAPVTRPGKADKDSGKPRFDFYKILPGGEEPKVQAKAAERSSDRATADRAISPPPRDDATLAKPAPETKAAERFWLQAGSFAAESEAENLKARLAMAGWEAAVQEATVPDKGVRYRVRIGPYDNTDELNRMKGELARRGFDVAVIKF
ncbi:MAG: SPOR domain-containing protein [Casimicrobiaceae bacterium]